jgi:acyl dehydratase
MVMTEPLSGGGTARCGPLVTDRPSAAFRFPSASRPERKVRGRIRDENRCMTLQDPEPSTAVPAVGAVARRTRRVSRRDIELFTEISGDRNPIHYDEELAARSRFGGLVVQGGVTSGLLNAVVAEDLPGPGSVFLSVSWRFLAPVRPGDELTARAVVTSVREDKPVTGLETTITNQDGVVVLDGTAVVWRDPAVAGAR